MVDQPYTSWQTQSPQPDAGALLPQLPPKLPPQITAVPVNNPPPITDIGRQRQIASVVTQPDPWVYAYRGSPQPYQGVVSAATLLEVDFPPVDRLALARISVYDAAWRASDAWQYTITGHQPFDSRTGLPVGVQVDAPPVYAPANSPELGVVIGAWKDDPWPYTFVGGRQPYQRAALHVRYGYDPVPGGIAFTSKVGAPSRAWEAEAWPYVYTDKTRRQPYQGRFGIQAIITLSSNPPFSSRQRSAAWMSIVRSWDAPEPPPFFDALQPLQKRQLPSIISNVNADNPPPSSNATMAVSMYNAWIVPDPTPQLGVTSTNGTFKIRIRYSFGFFIG